MAETSIRIGVNATSDAEANRLTAELQQWLKARVDGIELIRVKENPEAQADGSLLVAVFSAPAIIALAKAPALELAKGIADWLRKRRATVSIGADGSVSAENVAADDVERIILEALKVQSKAVASSKV